MSRAAWLALALVLLCWARAGLAASLLLAGDDSIPVFANAVDYLHDLIDARSSPHEPVEALFARSDEGRAPVAVTKRMLARIGDLRPEPGGSCLVFMTSHGERGAGFFLAGGAPILPADLDASLDRACGTAPTAVIVSSCFSGQFITPQTARPNRIILTAARADRTSFGCQASETFTIFDRCLLAAMPRASEWHTVYDRTRHCVVAAERRLAVQPSEPQAWFGPAAWQLSPPAPPRPGEPDLLFAGSGKPIAGTAGWGRNRSQIEEYRQAPQPKALVLGPDNEIFWVSAGSGEMVEAAARRALEGCEYRTSMACVLYAENDETVRRLPSGLLPLHPLILARDGTITPDRAPFVMPQSSPLLARYLADTGPKALAVDPAGHGIGGGHGKTAADARAAALGACGAATCIVIAEDDRIVLGWPAE